VSGESATAGNKGRFQYSEHRATPGAWCRRAAQTWIPEIGLYYYKARFYSPTLGRFLQTDPIEYRDQVNLYAYVGNDPVDGRDPTGLLEDTNKLLAEEAKKAAENAAQAEKETKDKWSTLKAIPLRSVGVLALPLFLKGDHADEEIKLLYRGATPDDIAI
jgi:RHS repeat-associated protein